MYIGIVIYNINVYWKENFYLYFQFNIVFNVKVSEE